MSRLMHSFQRWSQCVATAAAVSLLTPLLCHAQIARVELHPFQSTTLTDQEFLTGQKEGKPVILAGELRIPTPGTDRLPAVVLLHGSGGGGALTDDWAKWLNEMGVASFVIDSFTARGIVTTNNDQAQLGRLAMIVDAYRALAPSHCSRNMHESTPKGLCSWGFPEGDRPLFTPA